MIASRFLANAEMAIAIGIFRTLARDILLALMSRPNRGLQ
jgi:hypothetical protein